MYNLNCGPVVGAGASRSMPDAARPQATVGYGVDSCSYTPLTGQEVLNVSYQSDPAGAQTRPRQVAQCPDTADDSLIGQAAVAIPRPADTVPFPEFEDAGEERSSDHVKRRYAEDYWVPGVNSHPDLLEHGRWVYLYVTSPSRLNAMMDNAKEDAS